MLNLHFHRHWTASLYRPRLCVPWGSECRHKEANMFAYDQQSRVTAREVLVSTLSVSPDAQGVAIQMSSRAIMFCSHRRTETLHTCTGFVLQSYATTTLIMPYPVLHFWLAQLTKPPLESETVTQARQAGLVHGRVTDPLVSQESAVTPR